MRRSVATVIIPAYNEEETVGHVIPKIRVLRDGVKVFRTILKASTSRIEHSNTY
jgi:hypothetical protein